MIISSYNGVFFAFLAIVLLVTVFIWALLHKKPKAVRKWTIIGICLFNIALYWIYKFSLSNDAEFLQITGQSEFNWFKELPIQLCNINMFLIPIALLTDTRSIKGFCFFVAPLAAMMALLFPQPAFTGYSLLLIRNIGFYLTHSLIFICGISLGTLGFFKPKFRYFPGIIVTLLSLTFVIHIVNFILRMTVCPDANYFFTYDAEVSLLQLFWGFIPIPFLYELPSVLILLPYMTIVTLLCRISDRVKGKEIDILSESQILIENNELTTAHTGK